MRQVTQVLRGHTTRKRALVAGLAFLAVGMVSFGSAGGALAQEASAVQPEGCVWCHQGAGANHRADYVRYIDKSKLELTVDSVESVKNADGTFATTILFTIKKNGLPFIDEDKLPSLQQKTFYAATYDSATRTFDNSMSFPSSNIVALGDGKYSVAIKDAKYAPEESDGQIYAYIADGPIHTEPLPHVQLYDNVASAGVAFGDVTSYESVANVSGCEKCHGKPYMKHGYRSAQVAGLSDFSSCKSCHYDTRDGHAQAWQIQVNDPARFAELTELANKAAAAGDRDHDSVPENMTESELSQYAYKAKLMNDVHMSHAMEFPYPQSMANCATCHEGKLDKVLTDANFKIETCKSCHPVTGPEGGTDPHRAPALKTIMPEEIHASLDLDTIDCAVCHTSGGAAPAFSEIHTGYNPVIYADTAGTKYSDKIVVTIDDAKLDGTDLTFSFSATGSAGSLDAKDIVPDAMIGLYGYDTKDFIVNGHDRWDSNNNGTISRADGDLPKGEYEVGTDHKYWSTVSEAPGSWTVKADLSEWAGMINDGIIRRAELEVLPVLKDADGLQVALNAPSRTFDLRTNAFDDNFYSDIVKVEGGCNNCHDALATTFHTPDRGGNIVVCRTCHVALTGASHLELQSRSIDSFVHAIHSFQDFDIGDINMEDPVQAVEHEEHTSFVFPNFTIRNCQACHVPGKYEVPDQTKSLPGVLSPSDVVAGRNIQDVPSYVTGPAGRACGACHRAQVIKADDAVKLEAFKRHMEMGGYFVQNEDGTLDTVIKRVMGILHQ